MRQFDVCKNPNPESSGHAPYLVVLQSNVLEPIPTCVVAPLLKLDAFKPITKLNPVFEIESEDFILSTAELAGVRRDVVGEVVCNIEEYRDEIIASLDVLFLGI